LFQETVLTVATGVFVEGADQLSDSLNSNNSAPPFKKLLGPLSNDSPHMDYWHKARKWVSSWIFLKDGKPAFSKPPPSQNGWQVSIGAPACVDDVERGRFQFLET
jgi:hypothetical protein